MRKYVLKKRFFSMCLAAALVLGMIYPAICVEAYTYKAPYTVKVLESTGGNPGEKSKNIFDGNLYTKWYSPDIYSIGGHSFGQAYVIFKLSQPVTLSDYVITTANDNEAYPGRCPKSWTLYGSNKKLGKDDSRWKVVDKIDGDERIQNVNYRSYSYVPMAKNVSYQYYKLVIRETNGFSITELWDIVNENPLDFENQLKWHNYYTSKIGMQISGFDLRGRVKEKK